MEKLFENNYVIPDVELEIPILGGDEAKLGLLYAFRDLQKLGSW